MSKKSCPIFKVPLSFCVFPLSVSLSYHIKQYCTRLTICPRSLAIYIQYTFIYINIYIYIYIDIGVRAFLLDKIYLTFCTWEGRRGWVYHSDPRRCSGGTPGTPWARWTTDIWITSNIVANSALLCGQFSFKLVV